MSDTTDHDLRPRPDPEHRPGRRRQSPDRPGRLGSSAARRRRPDPPGEGGRRSLGRSPRRGAGRSSPGASGHRRRPSSGSVPNSKPSGPPRASPGRRKPTPAAGRRPRPSTSRTSTGRWWRSWPSTPIYADLAAPAGPCRDRPRHAGRQRHGRPDQAHPGRAAGRGRRDRLDAAPDDRLRRHGDPAGEGEAAGGPADAGPAVAGAAGAVPAGGAGPRTGARSSGRWVRRRPGRLDTRSGRRRTPAPRSRPC